MERVTKMSQTTPNITFDQVHTEKKQRQLTSMMEKTCAKVIALGNPTTKAETCPICHSDTIAHFTKRFGFDMSVCQQCAQIFCNPMPSKNQLSFYYNSEMKDFENEFFLESFEHRIPIFERRIEIINKYMMSGRLLYVGSAVGIFVEALKRRSSKYEIHCCDPCESACAALKSNYTNINTHQCMVEDLIKPTYFDGVSMWDTLEHISDPISAARKINLLLKDKGFWFFSTPNTDSLEWSIAQKEHVQILPPGHINLFNETSIEHMLNQSGFSMVESYTLNGSLDVSYIQKLLSEDDRIIKKNAGALISRHIHDEEFARLLAQFLVATKKAGNIFVIAQKTGSPDA